MRAATVPRNIHPWGDIVSPPFFSPDWRQLMIPTPLILAALWLAVAFCLHLLIDSRAGLDDHRD